MQTTDHSEPAIRHLSLKFRIILESNQTLTKHPGSNAPVQLAQPMSGGTAPTTDPTHVLRMVARFMGVYTHVYRNKFRAPSQAANGLTNIARPRMPDAPQTAAKATAWRGVSRPRTSTLFLVLLICESNGTSMYWFTVLAEEEMRATPRVERASSLGSSSEQGEGARQKPPADVAHTRAVRRNLDSIR